MRTSVPGNRRGGGHGRQAVGFTLLELLVVLAIVALSAAAISFALRDPDTARLEAEGERLAALLEQARVEARVTGVTVRWAPAGADQPGSNDAAEPAAQFRFVGLSMLQPMPTRWLDPDVQAQIIGGTSVLLGPQAILPAQRIVLRLGDRRLELATDGLGPFAAVTEAEAAPR